MSVTISKRYTTLEDATSRGGGRSHLSTQDLRKNLVAVSGAQYGGPHD